MKQDTFKKNWFILLILIVMSFEVSLFGATGDATTILKEEAQGQVSGELGWLVVLGGMIIAGFILMTQKTVVLPMIVFVGSIIFAMSPDLADGVIQQFGN